MQCLQNRLFGFVEHSAAEAQVYVDILLRPLAEDGLAPFLQLFEVDHPHLLCHTLDLLLQLLDIFLALLPLFFISAYASILLLLLFLHPLDLARPCCIA